MNIEELKVRISADIQQLKNALNTVKSECKNVEKTSSSVSSKIKKDADSAGNSIEKSTKKAGNAFKSFLGKIKVAAVITGLTALGKKAIEIASDLEEVQNVVDVSFGSMANEANEFAKSALKSFGLSELSAKQFSSTFMAMSNGLGLAAQNGKEMSINLTKLTADMASFFNVSQESAATSLKSVFTGETETLKKYGIVLTEANLKNFALSRGIKKAYSEMSEAEKVALRYNYVMQATSNVQGDFSRTSSSWANQIRILQENWKQLIAILGQLLVKVINPIIQGLNTVLEYVTLVGNKIGAALGLEVAENASAAASSMEDFGGSMEDAADAAKALNKQTMGFDEMNIMKSESSNSAASGAGTVQIDSIDYKSFDKASNKVNILEGVITKLRKAIEGLGKAFKITDVMTSLSNLKQHFSDTFNDFKKDINFNNYKDAFSGLFDSIGSYFSTRFRDIVDMTNTIGLGTFDSFKGSITEFINNTLPTLAEQTSAYFDIITQVYRDATDFVIGVFNKDIKPIFSVFNNILTDTQKIFTDAWEKHGAVVVKSIKDALKSVQDVINYIWESVISPVIGYITDELSRLWEKHLKPLYEKIANYGSKLIAGIMDLWTNVLQPVVKWIVDKVAPIIKSVAKTITDVVSDVIGIIADVIGGIIQALSGLIDFFVGVFTGDWKRAWNGIKDFVKGIWDAIWGIIKGAINLIIDGLNALWSTVYSTFRTIANGIGKAVKTVGSWIGKDWGWEFSDTPPRIPRLAKGGIVNTSTIANIGENGREAILPLENNTEWMDKLAMKLADRLNEKQPSRIVLKVGEREFGEVAVSTINGITKSTGNLPLVLA